MKVLQEFWNPDTIRLMRDASECADFYRGLAKWIAPRLKPGCRVCDAGCGLGYLSLELAGHAMAVTAVDVCAQALAVLEENCMQHKINNIQIRCGDIERLAPDTPYDAMVFCLFAGCEDVLRMAKAQCRGDVFVVMRNYDRHRFSTGKHPMEYAVLQDGCNLLDRLGIAYEKETFALDFGQPFRCRADARIFFERYNRDRTAEITDEFLESRLEKTGDAAFPYRMEHLRRVGILHFRSEDIPENWMDKGE